MEPEQDKTLKVLEVAIQMEVDGKKFYLKAAKESGHAMGKKLFESLAAEEDIHRRKFEEIYRALQGKRGWPATDLRPDGGKSLRTVFARAIDEGGSTAKAGATELDAVKTAIDMENKTYDYYRTQGQVATYDAEKNFYDALMAQEREHSLVLVDYYEYLKDPAGWFAQKEHPSLD